MLRNFQTVSLGIWVNRGKKRKGRILSIPAPLQQQAYYYTTIALALDVLPHPPCASPPCPPQR